MYSKKTEKQYKTIKNIATSAQGMIFFLAGSMWISLVVVEVMSVNQSRLCGSRPFTCMAFTVVSAGAMPLVRLSREGKEFVIPG